MKFTRAAMLAALLVAAGVPAHAQGGRVAFVGRIVEATCVMRDVAPDCAPGRAAPAVVRRRDVATARTGSQGALFDYALARDPAARWSLVEVTYR